MRSEFDQVIHVVRNISRRLLPASMEGDTLERTLAILCQNMEHPGTGHIHFENNGAPVSLEAQTERYLFRIVQELIGNTLKHAASKSAIVQVTKTDALLAVTVEDDGKGFDVSVLERSKGMGWTNIQHRVDFLKGRLDVRSSPGKGTSVHIEFNV